MGLVEHPWGLEEDIDHGVFQMPHHERSLGVATGVGQHHFGSPGIHPAGQGFARSIESRQLDQLAERIEHAQGPPQSLRGDVLHRAARIRWIQVAAALGPGKREHLDLVARAQAPGVLPGHPQCPSGWQGMDHGYLHTVDFIPLPTIADHA